MNTEKKIIDIDWEGYAEVFPDRYLNYSHFDSQVETEIKSRSEAEVLDIGGGKGGTMYLNQRHLKCWLLDPFIEGSPEWMIDNLDWEAAIHKRFDIIVARGCFNYLTRKQIQVIPSMLKAGGCFLFNTFYKPKSGARDYKNSRTDTAGIERFRYCQERRIIEHDLEPNSQAYIIRHTFFVYCLDEIIEMLGTNGLSFTFLGPNSLCVSLRRIITK